MSHFFGVKTDDFVPHSTFRHIISGELQLVVLIINSENMRTLFILGILIITLHQSSLAADLKLDSAKLIESARKQVGVTVGYDPQYRALPYPNGDVPIETGVCTDVLTRAMRAQGIDLQKEVHEDMKANFAKYPQQWSLKKPDSNIDHRRVPNLMTFFKQRDCEVPITKSISDYLPGDIVAWNLGGGITHIGLVSDRKTASGTPLIIHNIGSGAQEEDILFGYRVIGHYRCQVPK